MRARGTTEEMWRLMGRPLPHTRRGTVGGVAGPRRPRVPGAGAALAHGSTVRVSGIQAAGEKPAGAPGDPCRTTDPETGAPAGGYNAMTGSLIGCWYTDTGNYIDGTPLPDGVIVVAGTEHFV